MLTTSDVEKLNREFLIDNADGYLRFIVGAGGIPVIEVRNREASAVISLQGAHVLSWIPEGYNEVIWVSEDASFAPGKSIRGGIPVCWPWFGAHVSEPSYPAHGFARTVNWQVVKTEILPDGSTLIVLSLEPSQLDKNHQQMWPWDTRVEYRLVIGKTLKMELTTFNNSDESITIGQALHTYFNIGDITETSVFGLENKDYLDKTDGFKRKRQSGSIKIDTEVDRVYLQTADDVIIDNSKRKIIISKQGSASTVVWNPWKEVAEKMGDMGKDGYLKMLCVESANAAEDTVTIGPGKRHTLSVHYELVGG